MNRSCHRRRLQKVNSQLLYVDNDRVILLKLVMYQRGIRTSLKISNLLGMMFLCCLT
jgi:hypothetical protein